MTSLREFHRATGHNKQVIKKVDIVVVHDDTPRINWKLAVIEDLIAGNDRLARAANIRTAQGRTNIPISKLCPLEVSSNEPQPENIVEPHSTDAEVPTVEAKLT